MTAPIHIVGGFTFTGVIASIMGVNILQDYRLLPIILFASLLPDIDHNKSIMGKIFFPIAKAINRKYGRNRNPATGEIYKNNEPEVHIPWSEYNDFNFN